MPSYKLFYFDMQGRAEPIRLALNHAGVPFEDVRMQHEGWKEKVKSKYNF